MQHLLGLQSLLNLGFQSFVFDPKIELIFILCGAQNGHGGLFRISYFELRIYKILIQHITIINSEGYFFIIRGPVEGGNPHPVREEERTGKMLTGYCTSPQPLRMKGINKQRR